MTQEIVISEATSGADLLAEISAGSGDFRIVLQTGETFRSTGMVAIPSGVITPEDIGRVLEVAISVSRTSSMRLVVMSPVQAFIIDDWVHTETMPLGMYGKKLEVSVDLGVIPEETMHQLQILADASGRKLVGMRANII